MCYDAQFNAVHVVAFGGVIPGSLVGEHRRLGGIYRFHLRGRCYEGGGNMLSETLIIHEFLNGGISMCAKESKGKQQRMRVSASLF
jgi:hypothetical protein